jgi:hypothetical protein
LLIVQLGPDTTQCLGLLGILVNLSGLLLLLALLIIETTSMSLDMKFDMFILRHDALSRGPFSLILNYTELETLHKAQKCCLPPLNLRNRFKLFVNTHLLPIKYVYSFRF